ncbi:phosphoenolpyruvate synthase [Caloranaerobacter sp. DY30410]|uniref:phosphoenolpyruvate synthase n=1 Tax=Caloranaerobacter sp. DY30410 TaxID=3238305 RepID=UPI003D07DC16
MNTGDKRRERNDEMEKYVLYFKDIDKTYLPFVGGKGANLGEMTKAGIPVPQGFCVTTLAYRKFIEISQEMGELFNQLDRVNPNSLEEIRVLGKRIREHLQSISMPDDIQSAILQAWERTGKGKSYAVRSSATAEDLPTASFAGQQETYLNVRGQEQLLHAIQKCWASLFTDRAISYRAKNGFDHRSVFLSVVVQEMVFPEVSGIMFTADPISGNRKIISINASFGLGEALVSGLVSPDLYQIRSGEIIKKQISRKKIAIYPVPAGGTITKNIPIEKQEVQALPDQKILELAKIGQKIEEHYRSEQDIEWCLVDGKFYIVQSRPITSLYPVPDITDDKLHVFFSFGHQQMMTDAMKPLAISFWRTMMPFGKKGSVCSESHAFLEAGGRLFIDITELLCLKPVQKILPRVLSGIDELIASAISEVIERGDFQCKSNKQVKRKVVQTVFPIAKNIIKNLFFGDPSQGVKYVNDFMLRSIKECESFVNGASGAERIKRIQESLGNLLLYSNYPLSNVLPYPLSGVVAWKLIERLSQKWLGDQQSVHLLNKLKKSLLGNVTTELGLMIGDLADAARPYPQVIDYLQRAKDETFYEGLGRIRGGDVFERKLVQFMDKYGMRCPGEIDVTNPRWREAPTLLVSSIISHIRSVAPGEHREKFRQGEREAEQAAKEILSRIGKTRGGYFKKKLMSRLITVYRNEMGMREHPKYIIVQHFDIYKQAILDEGRALVDKGILEHEQDVFYLSLEELLALEENRFSGNIRELVQSRRKKYKQYQKLTPPRVMTSEGEVITGRRRDIEAPEGALIGTPVSAGVVEGVARVVLRPEEAKLNPGEILVAPFTDPGWTPLFNSAKGLVMEVGGMMTHGAVVAREYGIPAVVGIDKATEIIKDGDYIRVNGTQGYIQILEGDEEA